MNDSRRSLRLSCWPAAAPCCAREAARAVFSLLEHSNILGGPTSLDANFNGQMERGRGQSGRGAQAEIRARAG